MPVHQRRLRGYNGIEDELSRNLHTFMTADKTYHIELYSEDPSLQMFCRDALKGDEFQFAVIRGDKNWKGAGEKTPGDILIVDPSSVLDLMHISGEETRLSGQNFQVVLVGDQSKFAHLPLDIWREVDLAVFRGVPKHRFVAEIRRTLEAEKGEDGSPKISLLKNLFRQGKDRFGPDDTDDMTTLTLNLLKVAFDCGYASLSLHREGEAGGYDVSYQMGQAAPIYPSEDINDPGIVREGEDPQGMIKGIMEGEELASLIWSPIPGDKDPVGWFLLGKYEGDFSRKDLEGLMMFTAHVARIIQYIRLRLGKQREQEALFHEHQAQVKNERISSINRLMTSVAHLLNNPLQAIQINLELAARDDVRGQKQEHYLGVVQQEVERLRKIVADMVAHYRQGGRTMTWVSVNEVIESALALFEGDLEEQEIHVAKNLARDLPQVWGFSNQLRQVFIHLISNALDAMPQGGNLTLQTELQKDRIACMIRDDGKGIPDEHKEKIFEPFFSTKENCHGLGLTICDNIMTQHRGQIELVSTNQEGTSFKLTLPIGGQS